LAGIVLALGAATTAAPALAHTGLELGGGFAAGLAHPFLGFDHVLAMLSVGALAAAAGGRAVWALPLAFMGMMALGGALAMAGIGLPGVEQGIAASLIVFGAMLAARAGLPAPAALLVVGAFAVFHGHAHGAELPAMDSESAYAAGFVLATGALHLAGLAAAIGLKRGAAWGAPALRLAGGATAASGLALLLA
jgi:urease accessory protein